MPLAFRRSSLLAMLALLAAFLPVARPTLAASYAVTTLADSGAGSLRAAITSANASAGADTITFSVSGKITLSSALPALTDQAGVSINPGATTPTIEISGNGSVGGMQITSSNNTINGLILNGFTSPGITIDGSSGAAALNRIQHCYIGTNVAGTAAGSSSPNNSGGGILLQFGASDTTIDSNVISGNAGYGVEIYTLYSIATSVQQRNQISNNRIGVTADGSVALPNTQYGVYIADNSNSNKVGPGNIISGNGVTGATVYGVYIGGRFNTANAYISGNSVFGNKIGTNAAGTVAIPNAASGVFVGQSGSTTIGGDSAPNVAGGEGNIISGNSSQGIDTSDTSLTGNGITGLVIKNNWIGVNATGNAALANGQVGVRIQKQTSNVTIGPNNVISGNQYGVWLLGSASPQTRNNTITGNNIGVGADGSTAVPNRLHGVQIEGGTSGNIVTSNKILNNSSTGININSNSSGSPTNNTISANTISNNGLPGVRVLAGTGNVIGPGNTISGQTGSAGVEIQASQNTVKGNTISGNLIGISVTNATTDTVIGGTTTADGNNVINNTQDGVLISGVGTIRNKISHTTTNANGGKGISLVGGGNLGDQTTRPGLSGITVSGSPATLSGTVTNAASCGGNCTIEVFAGTSALSDEGPTFVTSFTSAGSFSNISLSSCGPYLIFTITDAANNTSEFISPYTVPAGACVPSAPAVTITTDAPGASRGVVPGQSTTYHHVVTNSGTGAGAVSISFSQTGGTWATVSNNTCLGQSLAASATCSFDVVVTVPAGATAGANHVATTVVTIGSASATQTDTTSVLSNPALTFVPEPAGGNSKTVGGGQPVTYQHKLTNTGNGPDTFNITVTPPSGWTYSVQPTGILSLAAGASTIVTVVLTPTAGIAAGSYAATVTATSRSAASVTQSVIDTTTITAAAVAQINSTVTNQGVTATIAYTVTNVGNQSGTFTFSFTPPTGWTVTTAPPASVPLAVGGSTSFTVVLQVPANALAGPYPATLTATADATVSKTDQIIVAQRAGLQLGPSFTDPVAQAPNTVITYTEQLTNTGNFADLVSLTAATTRAGWTVRLIPASVTLQPGASTQVKVELTIPPGQAVGVPNTTTITATSSLPAVQASAQIVTSVASVPGVLLTPALLAKPAEAGKPVTFTFTLINSGSINQSYTITRTNVPSGWASSFTPTSTPSLMPGESRAITLTLTPPTGTPDNTVANVTITARCVENTCADSTAIARLTVGPPYAVGLGGSCNGAALPGTIVTCTHTITNLGSAPDNYVITAISPLGWLVVAASSVFLQPGESQTFAVQIAVPTTADAKLVHNLTVTARSTAMPTIAQSAVDITTVAQVAGVNISPARSVPTVSGQEVQFQHIVLNTGNGADSFIITATQELNWSITIVPTQTNTLGRGIYQTVLIKVQVPPGTTSAITNHITIHARSAFDPNVVGELVDTIGIYNFSAVYESRLPLITRQGE